MLLASLELLFEDPATFIKVVPLFLSLALLGLLVGVTVHEFSHAMVASRMGDGTARRLGRVSLNPLAHLDPTGTLLFLLAGFGWGKPVPVNPYALKNGRRDMALIAAAGPLANVALVFLLALPIRVGLLDGEWPLDLTPSVNLGALHFASSVLGFLIFFNLALAVFNLIPLFPLDGSKVLLGLLPINLARSFARLEPFGPVLLILVIMIDYLTTGRGILDRVLVPVVNYIGSLAVG